MAKVGGYRPGAGRKTKYTRAKCKELIEACREGKEISAICRDWGISRQTFYNWLGHYEEFAEAWEIAETALLAAKEEITVRITETGQGNAQLHQFYLKNKFRDEYQDKHEIGHTNRAGEDVQVLEVDKRQLARALAATLIETQRETNIIDVTPEKDDDDV
jgi:transposase-like protein